MMFGFDLAIIVGAGPFLVQHFGLSDFGLGWAYSSLLFGCVLGSIAAGRLTDRFGRQRLLVLVAILFLITSLQALFAWRFLPETKGKTLEEIEESWSDRRKSVALPR